MKMWEEVHLHVLLQLVAPLEVVNIPFDGHVVQAKQAVEDNAKMLLKLFLVYSLSRTHKQLSKKVCKLQAQVLELTEVTLDTTCCSGQPSACIRLHTQHEHKVHRKRVLEYQSLQAQTEA